MQAIEEHSIRAKYPEEIANKLISVDEEMAELSSIRSPKFAIKIEHYHYLVKDRSKATTLIGIDNDAGTDVKIIRELKDPNKTHPYNMKDIIKEVNKRLKKHTINLINNNTKEGKEPFNQFVFQLIIKYYGLKTNKEYCYVFKTGDTALYSYSQKTVDFVISEIRKDPNNIIEKLKALIKKKITLGAKEF